MEAVRKFGVWVVSALLIIGAVAFYILVVRKMTVEAKTRITQIETRRNSLKTYAAAPQTVYYDAQIEAVRKFTEQLGRQTEDAELYLGSQPRRCNTRWFYDNEIFAPRGAPEEIRAPMAWLSEYIRHNEELRAQIAATPFSNAIRVTTLDRWGDNVPTPEQITSAMEYYWFQKDFADILTGYVEQDFIKVIEAMRDSGTGFPATPADLIINRSPTRLDGEFLRGIRNDADLRAVLAAILFNEQELDLALIFNRIMPDTLPWERPPEEQNDPTKYSVLGLSMDDEQRKFMDRLLPPGKPDYFNNQRFVTYVRDFRTVRYRSDVVRLLESHGFADVAESLRKGTKEEYARLLSDINNPGEWTRTKLAQAIAAVVNVKDETDYNLIKANHDPQIQEIRSYTFRTPGGMNGVPESHPDVYLTVPFTLTVKISFDRIPVFLRRLMCNNWLPDVSILRVSPVAAGRAIPVGAPRPGAIPPPPRPGAPATGTTPAARTPVPDVSPDISNLVDIANNVVIELTGNAHTFKPLLPKVQAKEAEAAAKSVPVVP